MGGAYDHLKSLSERALGLESQAAAVQELVKQLTDLIGPTEQANQKLSARNRELEDKITLVNLSNTKYKNRHVDAVKAIDRLVKLYDRLVSGRYLSDRTILHEILAERDQLLELKGVLRECF